MKLNPYVKFYFEAPDDNGGGEANQGSHALNALSDGAPAEPKPEGTPSATPQPGGFDAKALAEQFGEVLRTHLPPPKVDEPAPKQLSPAEAKKLLQIFEPDDNFFTEFNNLETQKAAFQKMLQGLTQQMYAMTRLTRDELRNEYTQQLTPLQQHYAEQEATARETRFNATFPDLAKPELKPIISSVIQQLAASGQRFKTEAETFTAIGSGVEAVIRQVNPGFKLTTASQGAGQTPKPKGNPNALTPTTGGAGGGAGDGGGGDAGAPKKGHALRHL